MKRAADDLIGMLEKSTVGNVVNSESIVLKALAPRLEPAQLKRAWDAVRANAQKWSELQEPDSVPLEEVLKALRTAGGTSTVEACRG